MQKREMKPFFSDAGNLETLTPLWLNFQILTPHPIQMHAGARIEYQLRLHGIPIRWRTEITHWQPPTCFVDEQRKGPYVLWVHRHDFETRDGGTLLRDHVDYRARGWIFEPLVNRLFVARDLRAIFAYRQQRVRDLLAPGSSRTNDRLATQ
jgi:ligand-binding SRPBCC domain-containing protein